MNQAAPLRIAIADDEPLARDWLTQLCARIQPELDNICVAQYPHGTELLKALRSSPALPFDVLLLDINMPGLSGLEIAAYLRTLSPSPAVIFVTALAKHAIEAFELSAVDYLLKPVRQERLQTALEKAVVHVRPAVASPVSPSIQVVGASGPVSIALDTVLFFQAEAKHTLLMTAQGRYTTTTTLVDFETLCAAQQLTFYRCHRAYLINLAALSAEQAQSVSGQYVPALAMELPHAGTTPTLVLLSRRAWTGFNKAVKTAHTASVS